MRSLLKVTLGAALAAVMASSASAQSHEDRAFLTKAIKGDNSETMLGKLGEERGTSRQTKDFGRMLATDHTQAREEAASLANSMHLAAPNEPMPEASRERRKLERLSGVAFDQEFARYMVHDHKNDIRDFEKEARHGHGAVADLARKTLPTLQKHLQAAQSLQSTGR